MTITREVNLKDFNFWGGAEDNAALLTTEELDQLEETLENIRERDSWDETEINDLMRFEFEQVCEMLELDYDEVMARNEG